MKLHGLLQLRFGILGGVKPGGERKIRSGAARIFRVDDERKNRMVEGRGRQLDLASLGQSAVHRDDFPDRRVLQRQDFMLLLFGESSVLRAERG